MIDISELKSLFRQYYKGYKNRVPLSILCDYFKVKNGRELRRAFKQLRMEGFLIVSNSRSKGYWYSTIDMIRTDPVEFDEASLMVNENKSRIKQIGMANIDPFEKALKPKSGQIKLPFDNKAQAVTY